MPPITINNNTIDPERAEPGYLPPDATGTNFILLQTTHPLNLEESSLLGHYGAKIQQVKDDHNTYLCRYEPSDLKVLESLPFVRHALVYHSDFVIHPLLKDVDLENPPTYLKVDKTEKEKEKGQPLCEVHITLHRDTTEHGDDVFETIQSMLPKDAQAKKVTSNDSHLRVFLPLDSLGAVAALDHVAAIHPAVDRVPQSVKARELLQQSPAYISDYPWYSTIWGVLGYRARYTGQGETIAIADTGMSKGTGSKDLEHPAFIGRIANLTNNQDIKGLQTLEDRANNSHGTHVAGCAAGWNSHRTWTYRNSCHMSGTAPGARIYVQKYQDSTGEVHPWKDLAKNMTENCPGARVHNNSISHTATDNVQKAYDIDLSAGEVDDFTTAYPAYLVVVGAGNDGKIDTSGSRGTRQVKDRVFNRQISGLSAAKNGLTVGATWNARDMSKRDPPTPPLVYDAGFTYEGDPRARVDHEAGIFGFGREVPLTICDFSSKGPTTQNILKPDIVAPGSGILSSATLYEDYQTNKIKVPGGPIMPNSCAYPDMIFQSGTSMATPQVAGLAACLRQAASSRKMDILGSTLRAMLVNGTVSCVGKSVVYLDFINQKYAAQTLDEPPDCAQGFGQASYRRSILHIDQFQPRTDDGYGPVGFHQAGDKAADGITDTNQIWPDFLTAPDTLAAPDKLVEEKKLKASSYILPGRNMTQLRVTLAYNDISDATLQHQLRLEVFQEAFNPTSKVATRIAQKLADNIKTYPAMDASLRNDEKGKPVTFGTIQKVTWKGIDPKILHPDEVMRFQMKVHADRIVHRDGPVGKVGFSLAWISSKSDDF